MKVEESLDIMSLQGFTNYQGVPAFSVWSPVYSTQIRLYVRTYM